MSRRRFTGQLAYVILVIFLIGFIYYYWYVALPLLAIIVFLVVRQRKIQNVYSHFSKPVML